jgi:transposase InsO family protein
MIKDNKLVGSMSRKGNCWDNAVTESFFHTLKVELTNQTRYKNRDLARQSIFQYIEEYYNNQRMHSSIDYRVPAEVELKG